MHFAIFTRETTFVILCYHPCIPSLFFKTVYSERKVITHKGSKLFLFKVEYFSNGRQTNDDKVKSPEIVSMPFKTEWQNEKQNICRKFLLGYLYHCLHLKM